MFISKDTLSFHLGRPTFAFWCTDLKSNGMVLFKVVFCYSSSRHSLPSSLLERLTAAQPGHDLQAHNNIGKDQCNQNQLNSFSFLNNDGFLSGISLSSDVCWETSKCNFHPCRVNYGRIPAEYPAMPSFPCVCLILAHRWTPHSHVSTAEATAQ